MGENIEVGSSSGGCCPWHLWQGPMAHLKTLRLSLYSLGWKVEDAVMEKAGRLGPADQKAWFCVWLEFRVDHAVLPGGCEQILGC